MGSGQAGVYQPEVEVIWRSCSRDKVQMRRLYTEMIFKSLPHYSCTNKQSCAWPFLESQKRMDLPTKVVLRRLERVSEGNTFIINCSGGFWDLGIVVV